jgi:hypothetical protein
MLKTMHVISNITAIDGALPSTTHKDAAERIDGVGN